MYDHYSFDEPWNGPNNIKLEDGVQHCYQCPRFLQDAEIGSLEHQHLSRLSTYSLVIAPNAVFNGKTSHRIGEIPDGSGNTIVLTEVRQHAMHWMSPVDVTPSQMLTDLRLSKHETDSNHRGKLSVAMADGSVRSLPHDLDEADVNALLTVDGGETVPEF